MDNDTMKRNVSIALIILAILVPIGAALNCYANGEFGGLTLEVLGDQADLDALRLSVMSAAGVSAVLMVLTGWQTLKNGNPRLRFLLGLGATLLVTVLTVFSRQQGGGVFSRIVNTLGMIGSFLAVTIANRERS